MGSHYSPAPGLGETPVCCVLPTDGQIVVFNETTGEAEWQDASAGVPESDPIFTASAAFGIAAADIVNWDSAYAHRASDGSDHTYIDQDVRVAAIPQFAGLGIGTPTPNAPLEVKGALPGTVGGYPSGMLQVTSPTATEFGNAVITGHNSFGGNKQLWYLGSSASSNDNVTLRNRQNGSLTLATNDLDRMTIQGDGKIGMGLTPTVNMAGLSIEAGRLTIKETTTPTADADYGKVYCKNDNKLYFQDGAGGEHEISFV